MATPKTIIFNFLMLFVTTVRLGYCSATVYKVGDSDGWIAKEDMYYEWAKLKEFHVGDSLIFEYDRNLNDVTQVSGGLEYEFCEPSSPKQVYNTGNDTVTLTEPGFYYFITSNHDQCKSGQKLDIFVVHDPSRPIPSPPPQSNNNNLPLGKIYKVGHSIKGWKALEDKEFQVGDNLMFEYNDNNDDDVLEISGDLEFIACDTTSPIAVHKSRHDLVKLTKPGVHYFISSDSGHCEAGLKLRVVVGPIHEQKKLSSPIDSLTRWLHSFMPHQH